MEPIPPEPSARADAAPPETSPIAEALVRLGGVTARQVANAAAAMPDRPPEQALIAQGLVSAYEVADLQEFLRDLAHAGHVEAFPFDPDLVAQVPSPLALRHQFAPMRRVGGRIVMAVPLGMPANAADTAALDRVATILGHPIATWPVEPEQVEQACRALYDPHALRGAMARAMQRETPEMLLSPLDVKQQVDAPIIDMVNDLLARAVEAGASDVHVDPLEVRSVVRLRIDGILHDSLEIPAAIAPAVVTRLKLMAELNIMERRHPQDGRFSIPVRGRIIDVRIATTPTRWGELVVLRLLKPLVLKEGLGDLGFQAADLARFKRLVAAPNGIVLVTGPTGSGKSTTLYAALHAIDRVAKHVVTIEDPIEYGIERAMQIQVNAAIGLTFAAALRSILRLDPNVILVGEIRDTETLEIAMHAAMTGHLVLSTLHANDALTTFSRLIELGSSPRQITSCLLGVVAQRLVRRVCARCTQPYAPTDEEEELLARGVDDPDHLQHGSGCPACAGTGYHGRLGVYEILTMDDFLAQGLTESVSVPTLRRLAHESGMSTIWDDARLKALSGVTTVAELRRVARKA